MERPVAASTERGLRMERDRGWICRVRFHPEGGEALAVVKEYRRDCFTNVSV